MESDCYVQMTSGTSVDDLRSALQQQYADETFVEVRCLATVQLHIGLPGLVAANLCISRGLPHAKGMDTSFRT